MTTPPHPTAGLLVRLPGLLEELNPAEARLARSVMADPTLAVGASVEVLAANAEVSTATVVRFCRTLGFGGIRDFRLALAVELNGRAETPALSPTAGLAQRILAANIQALEETVALLDTAAVEQAAQALAQATGVAAFAAGLSTPVALDAAHRLQRLGIPATYFPEAFNQTVRASNLGPGQVALLVSHSGRTQQTVQCARMAREYGALSIAVTSAPHSPLAQGVDIALIAATTEARHHREALASRLAHLAIVDILCGALLEYAPKRIEAALKRTRQAEEGLFSQESRPGG
ncbi:MurR/RpiR family transcriptional regulator [Deinococcus oregonensis]|uniref:MurR/RpiR family transcriptional regulator n=1 Tax=Deinococcus oregonensis TaxID=1805970 RepID=A0ABV6AVR4_9DEIO